MKKSFVVKLFLGILIFGLAACAPASAPSTPTEIPATEYVPDTLPTVQSPVVETTPVPVLVNEQVSGVIYVKFELAKDLPDFFKNIDLPGLVALDFTKTGIEWNNVGINYPENDFGPLFSPMGISNEDYPTFSKNAGRINTYFGEFGSDISFWPLDERIPEEVIAYVVLTPGGCNILDDRTLDCQKDTGDGSLNYRINDEITKFEFVVKGNYHFEYEMWIVESLAKLGFGDVTERIPETIIPGARYIISNQ